MKLLCWQEGEHWIVACRHFDVVAQGGSPEEAYKRFCQAFTATVLDRTDDNGVIGAIPAPPPDVVKRWEEKAALTARLRNLTRLN